MWGVALSLSFFVFFFCLYPPIITVSLLSVSGHLFFFMKTWESCLCLCLKGALLVSSGTREPDNTFSLPAHMHDYKGLYVNKCNFPISSRVRLFYYWLIGLSKFSKRQVRYTIRSLVFRLNLFRFHSLYNGHSVRFKMLVISRNARYIRKQFYIMVYYII